MRQLLETGYLNFTLDGLILVPKIRKPFSVLAEGPSVPWNRGDKTPVELFVGGLNCLASIFEQK
jgi:hypothetical protein